MKNGVLAENKSLASIRGVAALWVVGHHWLGKSSTPFVQTVFGEGHRAVDIFFVLSGLILTLVYRELSLGAVPRFMAQRVFRIYPLHMATLLALALVIQLPSVDLQAFLLPAFAGSMLLLQPYIHLDGLTTVNPVAWSIGVEMVYYLLFPFLLLALQSMDGRKNYKATLTALLCILFAVQLHEMQTNYGAVSGMDALQRGIYSFALGMVLAKWRGVVALSATVASAIECLACAAICVALALHQGAYVPGLAAVLIFSLSFDVGVVAVALRQRIWVWLGHISFSIYLLHYPIQVAMDKIAAFEALGAGDDMHQLLRLAALMAILLLVSTLGYRYVEMPCRHIPARLSAWWKSFTSNRWRATEQSVF